MSFAFLVQTYEGFSIKVKSAEKVFTFPALEAKIFIF